MYKYVIFLSSNSKWLKWLKEAKDNAILILRLSLKKRDNALKSASAVFHSYLIVSS